MRLGASRFFLPEFVPRRNKTQGSVALHCMTTFQLPQPKQGRGKETVSLVIDAARRAMRAAGETAVRVQEISAETGVSIGSIYHHFGDREGLIRAAYVHQFSESVASDIERLKNWSATITSAQDLRARYEDMVAFLANYYQMMPVAERATVVGNAVSRPELRSAIAESHTRLTDGLTQVMQNLADAGILKEHITPRAAAQVVLGLLHGRVLTEIDNDTSVTLEQWNRTVLSAFSGLVNY